MCAIALQTLARLLEENKKVLLVPSESSDAEMVSKLFGIYKSLVEENNILILMDMQPLNKQSNRVCTISTQEAEFFKRLYETYEFSNQFFVLSSPDTNCGNLFNYVKNGLLTEEECFLAFLEA